MKKWKLITLISSVAVVIIITVVLLVIFVFGDQGYKYPKNQPSLSNPNEVYLTVGSRDITNEDIYNTGIISYGNTGLMDLIDEILYGLNVTDEEYEQHEKELYATYNDIDVEEVDTNNEEQIKKFTEQMYISGYTTKEAIEKAIKLDIVRTKYAQEQYVKEINAFVPTEKKEYFFTDTQIQNAINSIEEFKTSVKALYVVFRSEKEAKTIMQELGIDTNNLSNGWKKVDGTPFTSEEVVDTFIKMYNIINGTSITKDDIETFKQSDISSISSTIASTVFNSLKDLEDADQDTLKECYVADPTNKKYLTGYYYLAVRLTSTSKITLDEYKKALSNGTTSDDVKKVTETLIDNTLSSTIINAYLYQNRVRHGIQIYDERLDMSFSSSFDNSALYFEKPEFTYELTTEESKEHLAKIIIKGQDYFVDADQLLNLIKERYGALVAVQYMNFYLFFNKNYSNVYDFENKEKLEEYTNSYNKNIHTIREQLEAGDLESSGYSKDYGWDNFLRDYFGLTNGDETVVLGDAYTEAVNQYVKTFFEITSPSAEQIYQKLIDVYIKGLDTVESYNELVASLDKSSYENTIVYQMCKEFIEFFSVKAVMLNYYFDENYDGVADEITDDEKHQEAKVLIDAFYYLAKNNPKSININSSSPEYIQLAKELLTAIKNGNYSIYTSLSTGTVEKRLNELITMFNIASLNDSVFGKYKKMFLRLSVTAEATYTDESLDNDVASEFKKIWNQVLVGNQLLLENGNYASFPLADKVNPETTALDVEGISNIEPYLLDGYYTTNNITSKVYITTITNTTWYHYYQVTDDNGVVTTTKNLLPPNLERLNSLTRYYELSLITVTDRDDKETAEYQTLQPVSFELPFVTNILGSAYDSLYDSDMSDSALNQTRKDLLANGTIKFADPKDLEICLEMIRITYSEETK